MNVVSSQWSVVSKRIFSFALCAMLFALCSSADAQQAGKIFRIGFLDPSTASGSAVLLDVFRQELSKLGWIEGKNFIKTCFCFAVLKALSKPLAALAVKYRLPAIYPQDEFVEAGGLMSYGADYDDLYRRAAVYVDKILKAAKPADLPVQQATKFEFVDQSQSREANRFNNSRPLCSSGRIGSSDDIFDLRLPIFD